MHQVRVWYKKKKTDEHAGKLASQLELVTLRVTTSSYHTDIVEESWSYLPRKEMTRKPLT